MKNCLVLIALLLVFKVNAQMRIGKDTDIAVEAAYNIAKSLTSTTLAVVVDEGSPEVSDKLKQSIKSHWTHTKYEFIKSADAENYLKKDNYSVLSAFQVKDSEKSAHVNNYMYAILLGDSKNKDFNDAKTVVAIDLPARWNNSAGSKLMDFDYLIPFFVKHFNQQVTYDLNRKVNETFKKGNAHFYNDGESKLATKKILIASGSTGEKFEIAAFCKNFGVDESNVSIVDRDLIEEAINRGDEKIAFVYDITSSGTIYDAKTTDALAFGVGQNMKKNNIAKWVMSGIAIGLFAAIVVSMKD